MAFTFVTGLVVSSVFIASRVNAESHTIKFDNQCGYGTPQLIQGGTILSTDTYTTDTDFSSAIAYLQTGDCLFNGEGCTTVEMTLNNPTCAGCGSSADISMIPPLAYSVPTAFSFYGVCEGQGASCSTADCNEAFHVPDDNQVQVSCQDDNTNLLITFCGNGTGASASSSAAKKTSTKASTVKATSTSVKAVTSTKAAVITTTAASETAVASAVINVAKSASVSSTVSSAAASSSSSAARKTCSSKKKRSADALRMHRRHNSHSSH